jgi:hypothetical protein
MGVGGVFAALHNNHFRPATREVKDYFVRRSIKRHETLKFNGLQARRPAEAGPHTATPKR